MTLDRLARLLRLSPTFLCEEHERIHEARPSGGAARRELRGLLWWRPLLCALPTLCNIRIRHLLTLSGLRAEMFDAHRFNPAKRALDLFHRCTGGGLLPHVEGWSYAKYIGSALKYTLGAGIPCEAFEAAMDRQAALASLRALPSGLVPDHDSRKTDTVTPSTSEFYTCEAFTVWRDGRYVMVQHDARIRGWRFRWNLHVGNSFGVVVREEADWPFWYEGWENKRIRWRDLAWRLWCPRMEVLARNEHQVVLRIGKEKRVITL